MEKALKPIFGSKAEKFVGIEKCLWEIEGKDLCDSMKASKMLLVSDIVIP